MGLIREGRQRASAASGGSLLRTALNLGCAAACCGIAAGVGPLAPSSHFGLIAAAYADDMSAKTVSLDIEAADLHEVVHMLQQQTGVNIVIKDVKDGDPPYGKVNVTLNHTPLDVALRHIAMSANAMVTKDDDGVYVIEPNTPGNSSESANGNSSPVSTDTGDYHWQKLILVHATPHDVLYLMHWDKDYRELAPPQPLGLSTPLQTTDNPMVYSLNGQAPPVPVGSGMTGPTGVNYAANDANSPNQAAQFPGGVYVVGGANGPNAGQAAAAAYGAQQAAAAQAFQNGPGGLPGGGGAGAAGNGLPDGVQKIYALQSDNSLLVLATPDGFQRVKEIVKNLDIEPKQVEIRVQFVTTSVSDADALGINYSLIPIPGLVAQTQMATPNPATFTLSYQVGSTAVNMLAALSHSHGKTVSAPIITTTNNVAATVQESLQIPYTTTSTLLTNGGTGATTTTQQFLNITTGLTVAPRINSDDTVTLQLSPQVQTPGIAATTGGIPPVTSQILTTLRTVKSGETMVLGGLITKSESHTQNRVPFLADLPIIGNLFRDKNTQVSDNELFVFVTPTIIGVSNEGPAEDSVTP